MESLHPVRPTADNSLTSLGSWSDQMTSKFSMTIVRDTGGVTGVAVVATMKTRPTLTKVDGMAIKAAIWRPHPGVIHKWKVVPGVKVAWTKPLSPFPEPMGRFFEKIFRNFSKREIDFYVF